MQQLQKIVNSILEGGFVMIPLLIFSFTVWAVVFERYFALRKVKRNTTKLVSECSKVLLDGEKALNMDLLKKIATIATEEDGNPLGRPVIAGLNRLTNSNKDIRSNWIEAMNRERILVNHALRRGLWILGSIATASPFIGLFGTVIGILKSFARIAETGAGGFQVVSADISEALVATAAGIIVAVISVLAYNVFQNWCNRIQLDFKIALEEITELLAMRIKE